MFLHNIGAQVILTGNHCSPDLARFYYISIVTLVDLSTSSFPGTGDVWFSLDGTTYQNNSNVILENIGEGDDALLCITNLTDCCHQNNTGGPVLGNWFFPNGTEVSSSGEMFITRGQRVVRLNRRRDGVEGIYRCEIPDATNVNQTLYIGLYSATTGEWWLYVHSVLHCNSTCNSVLIIHIIYVQSISGLSATWFCIYYI